MEYSFSSPVFYEQGQNSGVGLSSFLGLILIEVAGMCIPTVEELVSVKSRAELDTMYFNLTGSSCACCRNKSDVAKQIVLVLRERNLNKSYADIVV